ncbi:MAG: hypothetical protein E6R03_07190 [Hyphomicrobiaceae bacterium]|nr:MAG: hypothetical protein E6R03_07190 [Hyphomicrobiaceae bacterium]
MSAPFSGIATDISIQREATLGGAGSGSVFSLCGKVKVTQGVEFAGKDKTVNVWREQSGVFHAGKFYTGTLEIELGLNAVIELLLGTFFELEATESVSDGGGSEVFGEGGALFGEGSGLFGEPATLTSYTLRPLRLKGIKSCKLGLDFLGHSFLLEGVTIDSLRFDMRRNQVPKLNVVYKALTRESVSVPALADATSIDVRRVHHANTACTFDAAELSNLTEISLSFNNVKLPAAYGSNKQPSKFRAEPFTMAGQLVEYYSANAKLPAAIAAQTEHSYVVIFSDPQATSRKIEIRFPRLNFNDGMPDAASRDDLIARANFSAVMPTAQESDGLKIILVA